MSPVQPRALVLRVAAVCGAVLLLGTTAATAGQRPHDPNLDFADAAVEKAEILLQITSCGAADDKGTKECEKAVAKALTDLADARDEIAAAKAAADGGAASK